MKRTVLLAVVFVALISGCHKTDTAETTQTTQQPTTPAANAPAAAPSAAPSAPQPDAPPAPPPPLQPAPGMVVEAPPPLRPGDLDQLTFELRRYTLSHQHRPRDFQEFATASGLQIPPPPPGKKYVIDPNHGNVVLENQ